MLTSQISSTQKLRVDNEHSSRITHVLGRLLKRRQRPSPVLENLATVSIIRILGGQNAARQKRAVIDLIRGIPANRHHVIVDVSQLNDDDMQLPQTLLDVIHETRKCRMNVVIGGVSVRQELLLELTRICQVVRCYRHDSDAIQACLLDQDRNASLSSDSKDGRIEP